jgi:hypothetical protein
MQDLGVMRDVKMTYKSRYITEMTALIVLAMNLM